MDSPAVYKVRSKLPAECIDFGIRVRSRLEEKMVRILLRVCCQTGGRCGGMWWGVVVVVKDSVKRSTLPEVWSERATSDLHFFGGSTAAH